MEKNNVKSNQMLLESIDPLNMAPEQNSTSHILNALNDDCFREIFRYFDLKDLVNTSRVCVRFNQHAKEEFDRKYKNLTLKLPLPSELCVHEDEYENILKNFGPGIRKLQINFEKFIDTKLKESFLFIVSKYCTKLKYLKLFLLVGGSLEECQPLFSRLKVLKLYDCRHAIDSILAKCTELKVIKIKDCSTDSEFIPYLFTNNEKAHFDGESIAQCIAAIGQLRELKLLKLDLKGLPIALLIKTLADNKLPIEHLKLNHARWNKVENEAIKSLAKMQQIKVLKLSGYFDEFTDDNLIQLAKALPNLEEFRLRQQMNNRITTNGLKEMLRHANKLSVLNLDLDSEEEIADYIAMVKTFQGRRNKIKISIFIHNRRGWLHIPEQIVTENHDIKFTKF